MSLLELESVSKSHGTGAGTHVALRDVSFKLEDGELVAVWGRRRSGRSTLLRVAAGIEPPDSGVIRLDGNDISRDRTHALEAICYCRTSFRPAEGQLVLDQLVLAQLSRGVKASLARTRASDALRRMDADECVAMRPAELDAAERIRVALARAVVREPRLLVVDEPTLGLDQRARDEILALLRSLADDGVAVLASTADASGLSDADRALTLRAGELSGNADAEHAPIIQLHRARAG